MGLRQACCGESEGGGGREEEGDDGRMIHVGVLKGDMARRETIGGHLLPWCGSRGRPAVAVGSERSEIRNIDGIQVLVTGLFFHSTRVRSRRSSTGSHCPSRRFWHGC